MMKIKNKVQQIIYATILSCLAGCTSVQYNRQPELTPLEQKPLSEFRLSLEKDVGAQSRHFYQLKKIIDEAKNKIEIKENYTLEEKTEIFSTIDKILVEQGFYYKPLWPLAASLDAKALECEDYSEIYVTIGQELGLPIYLVHAPHHTFVRWDENGIHNPYDADDPLNDGDLNWEPTAHQTLTDHDYLYIYWVSAGNNVEDGFSLQTMNPLQQVAEVYFIEAYTRQETGLHEREEELLDRAWELNPKRPRR